MPLTTLRAGKPRALVDILWKETSGVDHPANESDGWVVMKAAQTAEAEVLKSLRAGESFDDRRNAVQTAVKDAFGGTHADGRSKYVWVSELFDNAAIFNTDDDKYWRVSYSSDELGRITLGSDAPVEVERRVEWDLKKAAEEQETQVSAHEALAALLSAVSQGSYIAEAGDGVRKSAQEVFDWLDAQGFVADDVAKADFTGNAPVNKNTQPLRRRLTEMAKTTADFFKRFGGVDEPADTSSEDQAVALMAAVYPQYISDLASIDRTAPMAKQREQALSAFEQLADVMSWLSETNTDDLEKALSPLVKTITDAASTDAAKTLAARKMAAVYKLAGQEPPVAVLKHGKFKHDNAEHSKAAKKAEDSKTQGKDMVPCAKCGYDNKPAATKCGKCGEAIKGSKAAA